MPLWDRYGRPLLNLRLVVTLRCNFRCFFCHSEGLTQRPGTDELTPHEYNIIAEAARRVGVRSFKITGGEPLVRSDIVDVVRELRAGHPSAEISLTTNAYLLPKLAGALADAGVNRVNVSLHSLRRDVFRRITGVDGVEAVVKGIEAAREHGLPVKINTVILKGLNDSEIPDMVEFASKTEARLQFIELHPVGLARSVFEKYHVPYLETLKLLEKRARRVMYRSDLHNRVILELDNGVIVEIVGPTGNPIFCAGCTRVRVTPYGEFTPCLNRGDLRVEFRSTLRSASSREEAVEAVIDALKRVNALREPYHKYRLDTPKSPRKLRSFRMYLPKRSGSIPENIERRLIREYLEE